MANFLHFSSLRGSGIWLLHLTAGQFAGILLSTFLLGVVVLRADSPSQRLIFSNKACVVTRNGKATLLIRIGNTKGGFCLQPDVRLSYVRHVKTSEGESLFKGGPLEVSTPYCFPFYARIDSDSIYDRLCSSDTKYSSFAPDFCNFPHDRWRLSTFREERSWYNSRRGLYLGLRSLQRCDNLAGTFWSLSSNKCFEIALVCVHALLWIK